METKRCGHCHEHKPLSAFSKCRTFKDGLQYRCKACDSIYKARYLRGNGKEIEERGRLRRAYGITWEQYQEMLEKQGGVCALCLRPRRKYRLHVDHCHETGAIRGLLCMRCNSALERVDSIPGWSERAVEYLAAAVVRS